MSGHCFSSTGETSVKEGALFRSRITTYRSKGSVRPVSSTSGEERVEPFL